MNDSATPLDNRATTLRYLPGLDGVRGISVLAVLVFHHYFISGSTIGWAPGGFLGVEVFFAVSGYLITSLLLTERRDSGRVSYRRFYTRRARRLLPALWTLLAVVVAYSLLFLPDAIGTLKGDVVAALTYTSNWWQILQHRSYFENAARPELLKHLWSLAIEEQYYLVWPLALMFGLRKLGRHRTLLATITVAFASLLLCAITVNFSINFAYYSTLTRLSGIMLGSAMAFVFAPYRIRGLPGRGARLALDTGGVGGLIFLLWSFGMLHGVFDRFGMGNLGRGFIYPQFNSDSKAVFYFGFLLVDIATLVVIAAAVHPASDLSRALGWRPLRWVGVRSYSLYLWHYPIFCITRPGLDFEHFGHLRGWPVFVLRFALSFLAADISYRYIETPIRGGAIGRYRERLRDANGARKRLLLSRGAALGGGLSLLALTLGMGLAAAQPQTPAIPGINEAAHAHDNGAKIDPSALAALTATSTTTTTTTTTLPATTTTVAPVVHPTRTLPTTTSTPPTTVKPPLLLAPPMLPAQSLGIGDSVMLGAKGPLTAAIPGLAVDAVVSRQFNQATAVLNQYKSLGVLPGTIIIHLGTNGRINNTLFDQIMQTIGPGHTVYFLTARVPRPWEAEVNATLHEGALRWNNAHVLEWHDFATCHDDWFVHDGFHLQPPGQRAYAAFIKDALLGHPDTTCVR